MKNRYLVIILVFVVSFGGAWILPVDTIFKGIFSVPAVLALIAALFQLLRDEAQYLKSIELQQQQHLFSLGAMSHMANIAFDKHIAFCERYMAAVIAIAQTLSENGPLSLTDDHYYSLTDLHREFGAWVSSELTEKLLPFEKSVGELVCTTYDVNSTDEPCNEELREDSRKRAKLIFNQILRINLGYEGIEPDDRLYFPAVIDKIREILDIDKLIALRKALFLQASSSVITDALKS